jgi:uncharacterized protein (DUF1778 family)
VIEAAEVLRLTARDHARVLEPLENPPKPNCEAAGGNSRVA